MGDRAAFVRACWGAGRHLHMRQHFNKFAAHRLARIVPGDETNQKPLKRSSRLPADGSDRWKARTWMQNSNCLAAQAEAGDQRTVALDFGVLQEREQALALADQLEQAAPGVVILGVGLEVLGQVVDALGEHGHLDLGRAGVVGVSLVLLDERVLAIKCNGHGRVSNQTSNNK